jgi:prefoldin alpha subunit
MEKQEYMMRMQIIEEEARQIENQIEMMDQQAGELVQIKKSLEELWQKEETPEFLANLGKGIFIRTKALEKELFVSIGKGTVVKKSPKETIEIITNQLKRVSETKSEFMCRINELQVEMQNLAEEADKGNNEKEGCEKDCECGENCECEDDCHGEECGDDCRCENHNEKK